MKWHTEVVNFLIAKGRETENINTALNKLEDEGWDIKGVELKDKNGYAVFIVASRDEK